MKFEFIDNSSIDRRARRQIRSHAAKGKNVGKKITRSSRKNLSLGKSWTRASPLQVSVQDSESTPESTVEPATEVDISLLPLAVASLSPVPAHWRDNEGSSSGGLALIQRAIQFFHAVRHPRELDSALDYATEPPDTWIHFMFVDEAYFHGAMAVFMAAFSDLPAPIYSMSAIRDSSAVRMRHLGLALRLVNTRLSGRDAVSNETIGSVLILSLYERYAGQYSRSLVHLEGIRRILGMRGGIRELIRTRPEVARKIFRSDVECSVHLGMPTRFTARDLDPLTVHNPILTSHRALLHPFPSPNHPPTNHHPAIPVFLNPPLASLLQLATHTARLIHTASTTPFPPNNNNNKTKLDSVTIHETFLLLGYRLQALAAPAPDRLEGMTPVERAVCVGLTAFLASFLWGGGCGALKRAPVGWVGGVVLGGGVVDQILHSRHGELGEGGERGGEGELEEERSLKGELEVVLWMLFVGVAAGVFGGGDVDEWAVPKTGEVLRVLGLREWEKVVKVLEGFPWVEVMHGGIGRVHLERSLGFVASSGGKQSIQYWY